jgi:hypothetical protein
MAPMVNLLLVYLRIQPPKEIRTNLMPDLKGGYIKLYLCNLLNLDSDKDENRITKIYEELGDVYSGNGVIYIGEKEYPGFYEWFHYLTESEIKSIITLMELSD